MARHRPIGRSLSEDSEARRYKGLHRHRSTRPSADHRFRPTSDSPSLSGDPSCRRANSPQKSAPCSRRSTAAAPQKEVPRPLLPAAPGPPAARGNRPWPDGPRGRDRIDRRDNRACCPRSRVGSTGSQRPSRPMPSGRRTVKASRRKAVKRPAKLPPDWSAPLRVDRIRLRI